MLPVAMSFINIKYLVKLRNIAIVTPHVMEILYEGKVLMPIYITVLIGRGWI